MLSLRKSENLLRQESKWICYKTSLLMSTPCGRTLFCWRSMFLNRCKVLHQNISVRLICFQNLPAVTYYHVKRYSEPLCHLTSSMVFINKDQTTSVFPIPPDIIAHAIRQIKPRFVAEHHIVPLSHPKNSDLITFQPFTSIN